MHPDTRVTVEAPLESDLARIEEKVRKRAAWIVKQQRNFERYSFEMPPRQYVSGETHRYLGNQYRLKVLQSENGKECVIMDRERILIKTKNIQERERKKKLLVEWYRGHAGQVYRERVVRWYPRFERYEIVYPQVVVRQMKSRWGSCTAAGKITLNLKLIQFPKQLIDYIIVHELCHIIEHNHSAEFYALMSRIMPDWEERRKKLSTLQF